MQRLSVANSSVRAPDSVLSALRMWGQRQWLTVLAATVTYVLVVGIPTDLIPNPIFGREIPPTWWSWPSLLLSAGLIGVLAGTYVSTNPVNTDTNQDIEDQDQPEMNDPDTRRGLAAGMLTFFAVGCPVCNKIVLLALGSAGAIKWFEPMQPLLQVAAVVLLVWALTVRLRNQNSCAIS